MSDFVAQCRAEWKRLGVPDPHAEEMAADLTSDLAAAEADGVSAEEFLGRSFFDPRSFAASWASERGIVPDQSTRSAGRRPLILAAFTALAVLTVVVTALLLVPGSRRSRSWPRRRHGFTASCRPQGSCYLRGAPGRSSPAPPRPPRSSGSSSSAH